MKASMICVLWALVVFITQGSPIQAQECKRTNSKPYRYCIDTVCTTNKDCKKDEKCLCDGDCGLSCVKNDLKCDALRKPKNAIIKTTGNGFRDTVTYTCKDGFTLRGSETRTCRGIGKWDGRRTRCPRLCKDPGDIKFGNKNEDKRYYKVGSTITYWCFPGYETEGKNKLTCTKAGTWSSPPPKCNLPTCLKPTSPPNANSKKRLKDKYQFNQIIIYECEYGHFSAGIRFIRCLDGGKWSSSKLRCIPKSCGDPGSPKNGRRRGYLFTFKKKVYYECDRGHILIGPQFRQCQSNQKWSDDIPSCQPVDCGRLPTPQYGEKIGETKTTYLGKVSFRCKKKGYQLKGSSQRVCQESGKWDGTLTRCEPVECQDPGIPDYGGRNPDLDKYVYEKKIEYSCKTNHTLKGERHIICQHDKTWTGNKPTCLRPCDDPGIPNGGSRLQHSFLHGDKVSFTCKRGWNMEGEKNIECKNGKWDNKAPTCMEGCSKPRHSINGYIHPRKDFYINGERVSMYCDRDYKLIGDTRATCRNGQWGSKPSCKRKCYNPGAPEKGWRNGDEFFEGKRVTFRCNRDYDLIGQQSLECLDTGRWSASVPTCKRRCTYSWPRGSITTPNMANGVAVRHGTSIKFDCIKDYTLVGQKTAVCSDGRWNPSIPSCKAKCKDPGKIPNGYQNGRTFTHSGSVSYSCKYGYSLDGQRTLICNDGQWNGPVPSCKKWCTDPGEPKNGYKIIGDELRPGSRVQYACKGGTQLVGSRSAICNDGQWSKPPPKCLKICQSPKTPKNGGIAMTRTPPLSGDKATFSCNSRYDLVGRREIFCVKGSWNGTFPRCVGRCGVPNNIKNLKPSIVLKSGDWLQSGTKIGFTCSNKEHVLEGRKSITCESGHWNHNFPKCKVPCKEPSRFSHGSKNGDQFKQEFECNLGYTLFGSSVINCVDGNWNKDIPKCYRNCQDFGGIKNGIITNNGFKHGDKISVRCNNGFRIQGSPELRCNDGKWTNKKPKCVGVCTYLSPPTNGEMLDFNFDYGSTVRFRCKYGFSLRGPENVTCNKGRWRPNKHVTVCKANCPDPGIPANGGRQGDHPFTHQETVHFSCKKEFTMIGFSTTQCIDGRWTAIKPDCTECGSPLGMEKKDRLEKKIPDKNIQASSRWRSWHDGKYGRLNGPRAWCSGLFDKSPYLEIDLKKPFKITYIATQGSARDNKWVAKYIISHTLALSSFMEYRENADKEKIFNGNTDATSVVKHKLEKSFIARKVRFQPIGWKLFGNLFKRACMRVEIYGCELPTNCVMVGSRVLGRWGSSYSGGDYYYKSYVKTIDDKYDEVQLEIEDYNHHSRRFITVRNKYIVLDVPNKRLNLPRDTRVLVPNNNKYYTGTIVRSPRDYHSYGVRADYGESKWHPKTNIRVLTRAKFCEG